MFAFHAADKTFEHSCLMFVFFIMLMYNTMSPRSYELDAEMMWIDAREISHSLGYHIAEDSPSSHMEIARDRRVSMADTK